MSYALLNNDAPTCRAIVRIREGIAIATILVLDGVEFHSEPLPDDRVEITVKKEACSQLDAALRETA